MTLLGLTLVEHRPLSDVIMSFSLSQVAKLPMSVAMTNSQLTMLILLQVSVAMMAA
jgi:hypothetical protein